MKKILTATFLFLGITSGTFAQNSSKGTIKISFSDGLPIAVNVDGNYYDDRSTIIEVKDLEAGEHKLLIYKANGPGSPQNSRPPIVKEMTVNTNANSITTIKLSSDGRNVNTNTVSNSTSGTKRSTTRHSHHTRHYSSSSSSTASSNTNTGNDRNEVNLQQSDLNKMKQKAQRYSKDADKIVAIQSEIDDRGFTTDQVRTMLGWLKGERAKLTFAKWAYKDVTDEENYKQLKSEFKLASSKKSIDDLVARRDH